MRYSIRFKIIIISVLAILSAVAIVFGVSYFTMRRESARRSVETMNLVGEDAHQSLEKYFQSIEQSVEMAANIAIDALDSVVLIENGVIDIGREMPARTVRQKAVLDAYLSRYYDSVQDVFASVAGHTQGIETYFYVVSPDVSESEHGFFYSRIGKAGFDEMEPIDAATLDPADLDHNIWYYAPIKRGRPSWVGPYRSAFQDERWICSYLVPIYKSGTFIGELGMDIPLETLVEQIRSIEVYDTGFAALLDEEGRVFYHPELEIGSVPDLEGVAFTDEIFQQKNSGDQIIRYFSGSQERQMAFSTLSNGLKLFIVAPTDEINAPWARMIGVIVPVTAAVVIAFSIILMFVMRILTRPLQTLTAASTRLAAGDYDVELKYDRKDEVGELTGAFKQMRDQQKLYIEDLNRRVHTDVLTGLPNLRYFFELVEIQKQSILESGDRPAIVYFNIIGTKYYNRQFGFEEGDRLIREVGNIIAGYYGEESICRLAQDHFAAITGEKGLEEGLEKIFRACETADNGRPLLLRAGIYRYRMEEVSAVIAIDRAKYACDRLRGAFVSGYYNFDSAMIKEIEDVRYIINNLDRALEERWIRAYFQPIIRSSDGTLCDEETLARWMDPVKGMISPGDFIPILEKARLIYKLDLYMLDRILEKIRDQIQAGREPVPQSLNLSRADFDSCDIVEEIRGRVDAAGIPRELVTIEITESMVGSDFEFMKARVERFQALGFRVWMDDFGSGYSALDVLQDIRFDVIKFDMRFMKRFDDSGDGRIILKELLHMTEGLKIETVCEGVETKEQAEFLKEAGCTRLQGFYFGRPAPYDEGSLRIGNNPDNVS